MSLNETPRANRLHIGIYGRRNAGKSSLINALTGQDIALVSPEAGTTTDPVFKSMELHPVGPVVFIDTAGFDDEGPLGRLRVERTQAVMEKTDVAIVVMDINAEAEVETECRWIDMLTERKIPVIIAVNKTEELSQDTIEERLDNRLRAIFAGAGDAASAKCDVIPVSAVSGTGIEELRSAIERAVPEDYLRERILGDMIGEGELALLVMPQDIQAPKGRLILPQVQTIRELLDRKCTAVATTADGLERALDSLKKAPI